MRPEAAMTQEGDRQDRAAGPPVPLRPSPPPSRALLTPAPSDPLSQGSFSPSSPEAVETRQRHVLCTVN